MILALSDLIAFPLTFVAGAALGYGLRALIGRKLRQV